ncbi:MAG: NYN domain-containing protein [Deltaproteobacteria bacterium]|nr:NYN domain-containing protein [Deltaproteobacteria bacterium]
MHIIIDGYNLIRQSASLRRLERFSLERGRSELIRMVAGYRRSRGHKVTVVFDGWMAGSAEEERLREDGVYIVYSRRGETADEVIKRMARAERGSEIIVVSSDREVANSAVKAGGVAISSPEFEERMGEEETKGTPCNDEIPEEDDDTPPRSGNGKKGAARKKSKRQRQAQRRLNKL